MKRREFITLLGGAVAWPLAARAQQRDRVRRIGVLLPFDENDPVAKTYVSAFTQALADLGWTDGRNARIDLRWHGESGADRAWITNFLARPRERRLPREVLRLYDIIASSGGIEWAQHAAAAFAEAATREFESSAFAGIPAGPDLEWLRSCINSLVRRDAEWKRCPI
jgi:hypothetical protein